MEPAADHLLRDPISARGWTKKARLDCLDGELEQIAINAILPAHD
jgi:hypothetical protein